MMKRLTAIIVVIMTLSLSAWAANPTAEQVLAKTSKTVTDAKSLTAEFVAKSAEGQALQGTLTMSKEKFSMLTAEIAVWYNGEDMWTYNRSAGETTVTTPTVEELLEINPFDVLRQQASLYKATMLARGKGDYKIGLVPYASNNSIRAATLIIDAATHLPKEIEVTFGNGSKVKIAVTSVKTGDGVPSSAFSYPASQFPNIEIIDLR